VIPERVAEALRALPAPRCAYLYDPAVAVETARAVRACLPPDAGLLFAVKANGHPALAAALAGEVDGFEVASGGELALARAAGARRIAFSGPAKTDGELRAAVSAGATVHVEGLLELRRLSAAAVDLGAAATVALRVNRAGATLPGSHRMTGEATPFGIDEDDLPDAVALARGLPGITLVGFHLHAVSNNLDAEAHTAFVAEAVRWSLDAAVGFRLAYVNLGGGFGVDYTGPRSFDLDLFGSALRQIAAAAPGVELVFEPGRLVVADAGWYAAEVIDLKRVHGRWFAVVRGGTHHFRLPAAWGYSHPCAVLAMPDWLHPFERPSVDEPVDVVGELCTPRDVLARDQSLGRVRVGDVIVLGRAGAYGWDISHHDFLRHDQPTFVLI
jgi:diaminopimelate decarboxylase